MAGDFVAYLTDTGAVWVGRLNDGAPTQVDPDDSSGDGSEEGPQYAADAIAVDDDGILYSYSEQGGAVLRYDIGTRTVRGVDDVRDRRNRPGDFGGVGGVVRRRSRHGGGVAEGCGRTDRDRYPQRSGDQPTVDVRGCRVPRGRDASGEAGCERRAGRPRDRQRVRRCWALPRAPSPSMARPTRPGWRPRVGASVELGRGGVRARLCRPRAG